MASMWRKAMLYLGLGPDEDYDDYDVVAPPAPAREPMRRPAMSPQRERDPESSGAVRTLGSSASLDDSERHYANGSASNGHGHSPRERDRDRVNADRSANQPRPRPNVVRPMSAPAAKPHVVAPASFTDAQEVADEFKRSVPVIVNLQGVERDLMRRIIDFSSGLCYGLGGQMERVANHVYLLTPSDVEVSPEERRRWRDHRDGT
jgi:cell division inhibitor SepF